MSDNKFKNFAVLTLDIHSVEVKESKKGGQYAVAQATLPMGEGKPALPFRVIVNNGLVKVLKADTSMTLVGHIGYEEKDSGGKEHREPVYLFFPYKFEEAEKPRNFIQLTLRAGKDADCRYTESGAFWGFVRMALGMGKDEKGAYKPSLWFTVKAFSRDGDETLVNKLATITKGSLSTVSGRLSYEVYDDKGNVGIVASKFGDFEDGAGETSGEEAETKFEEPNFG